MAYLCGHNYHKSERYNQVSRLLLNEFSFYLKKGMFFTKDEFIQFINHIKKISITKKENVHLLLSSFPVSDGNNKIINTVLYVQCGIVSNYFNSSKVIISVSQSITVSFESLFAGTK